MPELPKHIIDRLAKVAGLLGSANDGERSAAAYRATQILRDCGLTWRDVIEAAGPRGSREVASSAVADLALQREQLNYCLARQLRLNQWERKFLQALSQWRGRLTEKQHWRLEEIYLKLRGE